jgi:ATP-dependent Zn protease
MEALDGLAEDSDIAFVLTTNRPDLLETALVQRPGRVDLAVEIPLPDLTARRMLLDLYARGLPLSPACLGDVAARTAGTTASLAKELLRRVVLHAAEQGVPVGDQVMETVLDELLDDRERLTRSLVGAAPGPDDDSGGTG